MIDKQEIKLIVLFVVFWVATMYFLTNVDTHVVVRYDCRIAEISPDVPAAVKEKCRKKLFKNDR
jgi:hypothetical protein